MHAWIVIAASTAFVYVFVVLAVRVFGRHALSQLSPVDLLVVMLLGSSVETAMVHGSTSLMGGFVSASVLLVLNQVLTLGMLKIPALRNLVAGGPLILVNNGVPVEENLKRAGLTQGDLMEALRERECGDCSDVKLAIMEPDGEINVVLGEEGPK